MSHLKQSEIYLKTSKDAIKDIRTHSNAMQNHSNFIGLANLVSALDQLSAFLNSKSFVKILFNLKTLISLVKQIISVAKQIIAK